MQHVVQEELEHSAFHPWAKLKQLGANKMFSDMIESILGAIYLDSGQEHSACRLFSQRLGVHRYAKRVIDEQIDVTSREAPIDPPEV
ncbi:Dicer-like protein 2 [Friedmanniomyces endolithicus]|nr:Dicer-like protein 2 [Friedmanniomyces endolithicus]